jgi:hypothetical protein
MSRKTIVFKTPRPADAQGGGSDAPAGADDPAAAGWVLARQESEPSAAAPPSPSAMSIDLAAERSFAEAATLGLALPAMLGWFWFNNALDRYRRMFAR